MSAILDLEIKTAKKTGTDNVTLPLSKSSVFQASTRIRCGIVFKKNHSEERFRLSLSSYTCGR